MKHKPFLPVFFHRIHKKMIEEHSKILSKHDLTKAHVPFIVSLYDQENGLYQSELARTLDFNRAHISRTLKDLEEKGFVKTKNESSYKHRYFITSEGKAIASEMKEAGKKIRKLIFSALTSEEIKEFERLVKKMTDTL